jgi:hypothetical protein
MVVALLALQLFVVLFIGLHDWIPLGSLNDVGAVQATDSRPKLLRVTVLSTLPFAIGLVASFHYARTGFPNWLLWFLWITYGATIYGMLRAWWIPYLLVKDSARALRYQAMFSRTHAFLSERNGIRPDTLHVTLHVVIIAIVILLGIISFDTW